MSRDRRPRCRAFGLVARAAAASLRRGVRKFEIRNSKLETMTKCSRKKIHPSFYLGHQVIRRFEFVSSFDRPRSQVALGNGRCARSCASPGKSNCRNSVGSQVQLGNEGICLGHSVIRKFEFVSDFELRYSDFEFYPYRPTRNRARPIAIRSSGKAMKMSLIFHPVTRRLRTS
jgi:hypothetical protein